MESSDDLVARDDKSLPINWESSGMLLASEFSNNNTLINDKQNKTATSMPDLSMLTATMPKAGSSASISSLNHVSRYRSGTPNYRFQGDLKEHEQQFEEYRKENFRLRIQILFLREQLNEMKGTTDDNFDSKTSQAVELNTKINDLEDKLKQIEYEKLEMVSHFESAQFQLEKERENVEKRDKIIQGLLKRIETHQSQESASRNDEVQNHPAPPLKKVDAGVALDFPSLDLNNISSLTDPSLVNFTQISLGYVTDDNDSEILKQKLRELEIYNQNFIGKINRVADSIMQVAQKLDGDTSKMLVSFSEDLSKMGDNLIDSSILFNQTENEKEIEKLKDDLSGLNIKIEEMAHVIAERDELIEDLSAEKAKIADRLLEIESRFAETKSNYLLADEQLKKMKSEYENKLEHRQLEHASEIRDLKTEFASFKDALEKDKRFLNQELRRLEDDRKREELHMDEKVKNLRFLSPVKSDLEGNLIVTDKNLNALMTSFFEFQNPTDPKQVSASSGANQKHLIINEQLRRILLQQLEELKVTLRNVYDYMENEKLAKKKKVIQQSSLATVATQISQPDENLLQEMTELKHINFKLERYAKILKGKYRRLQSMFREATAGTGKYGGVGKDENICKKLDFDDDFETFKIGQAELDEAVKRLEENNRVLALKVVQHEKKDDENKMQAKKYLNLKKKKMAELVKSE